VGVGDESTGQAWARWFALETEFLDEKQNEKTNEKRKVPEKHLLEVFFSFILFFSSF